MGEHANQIDGFTASSCFLSTPPVLVRDRSRTRTRKPVTMVTGVCNCGEWHVRTTACWTEVAEQEDKSTNLLAVGDCHFVVGHLCCADATTALLTRGQSSVVRWVREEDAAFGAEPDTARSLAQRSRKEVRSYSVVLHANDFDHASQCDLAPPPKSLAKSPGAFVGGRSCETSLSAWQGVRRRGSPIWALWTI